MSKLSTLSQPVRSFCPSYGVSNYRKTCLKGEGRFNDTMVGYGSRVRHAGHRRS